MALQSITHSVETRWALSSSTTFGEEEQNFYYDMILD